MLFLFRKLRNKALFQHAAFTYLLYAVGEIILLVIGILIALQVNEWNTNRKNNKLESSYYCRLLEDVEQDQALINSLMQDTERRINACNDMIALLQEDQIIIESVTKKMFESIALMTFTFKINQAAFEDIKSSGNLNILKDEDLKVQLIDYYNTMGGFIDVVDRNADGTVDVFYNKDDYASAGWQYFDLVQSALDKKKVNLNKLDPIDFQGKAYRQKMISDALYYMGANSRVRNLYQSMVSEIIEIKNILVDKCDN